MSAAKVDGPEFWGLTRLTLAPRRQSPDFQHGAQRKGQGLFWPVLKVGSLPPSHSGKSKMSVRQSAPFAAPAGLDGVFPVQREGSSLPLPAPVPAVSLRFSTWSAAESRFGGVENRSLTASCPLALRRSSDPDGPFRPVRWTGALTLPQGVSLRAFDTERSGEPVLRRCRKSESDAVRYLRD